MGKEDEMRAMTVLMALATTMAPAWAGTLFFAVGFNGEFTHIDSELGQVAPTGTSNVGRLQALATSTDGSFYTIKYASVTPGGLYSIDPWTGEATWLFQGGHLYPIRGMAMSPGGSLYVTETPFAGEQYLGVLDVSDGSYQRINRVRGGLFDQADGLDFSPSGVLYGTAGGQLYTINPSTARLSVVGTGDRVVNVTFSIAFTPEGRLFAVGRDFDEDQTPVFVEIDPLTGLRIRETFPLDGDYRGLALVPEPTAALLGIAGVGVTVLFRRRRIV